MHLNLFDRGSAGLRAMTEVEQQVLQSDFTNAKSIIELELRTKLDFWVRLPWLLAALALPDEESARAHGQRALHDFHQDPRQEVHHRKTWDLLRLGVAFLEGLLAFLRGTPRWECGLAFTSQVSVFRLWSTAETVI